MMIENHQALHETANDCMRPGKMGKTHKQKCAKKRGKNNGMQP
jgi:hypothetical protein